VEAFSDWMAPIHQFISKGANSTWKRGTCSFTKHYPTLIQSLVDENHQC